MKMKKIFSIVIIFLICSCSNDIFLYQNEMNCQRAKWEVFILQL